MYAVEIGKVMLTSTKPITEEDKKAAARLAYKNSRIVPVAGGAVVLHVAEDLLK